MPISSPQNTVSSLCTLSQADFVQALDGIFEHSPWVAERVWHRRPFDNVPALHQAMLETVHEASPEARQALIDAHPELAGREAAAGHLTAESGREQRGAGLDQCTGPELERLRKLNAAYRARFGFPFIIAVKGRSRQQILDALSDRLDNSPTTEYATCLAQIGEIARLRLAERFSAPDILPVKPLTAEAFLPFGELIHAHESVPHFAINEGNTQRYHDLAHIDPGSDGRAIVSIFRGQPHTLPISINMMERHPKGSQAFMPLSGHPYLVIVARPGATPTLADLHVFHCPAHVGVNYAKGVWHHPLLALHAVSDFLVIDRAGPGDNCDVVRLDRPGLIQSIEGSA